MVSFLLTSFKAKEGGSDELCIMRVTLSSSLDRFHEMLKLID